VSDIARIFKFFDDEVIISLPKEFASKWYKQGPGRWCPLASLRRELDPFSGYRKPIDIDLEHRLIGESSGE